MDRQHERNISQREQSLDERGKRQRQVTDLEMRHRLAISSGMHPERVHRIGGYLPPPQPLMNQTYRLEPTSHQHHPTLQQPLPSYETIVPSQAPPTYGTPQNRLSPHHPPLAAYPSHQYSAASSAQQYHQPPPYERHLIKNRVWRNPNLAPSAPHRPRVHPDTLKALQANQERGQATPKRARQRLNKQNFRKGLNARLRSPDEDEVKEEEDEDEGYLSPLSTDSSVKEEEADVSVASGEEVMESIERTGETVDED